MNYFHTDDARTIEWLANVFTKATKEGSKVRIHVNDYNVLKVKVNEGMWTPPIRSTPDPYRDDS